MKVRLALVSLLSGLLFIGSALLFAGCDAEPAESAPDPPPLGPLLELRVEPFGRHPASQADIEWDEADVRRSRDRADLPWSTPFRAPAGSEVYLRAAASGGDVGMRLELLVNGRLETYREADGLANSNARRELVLTHPVPD